MAELLELEDGSALCGDDSHVVSVRDAETGAWERAEPGREYFDAAGRPWPGLPLDATTYALAECLGLALPDTALEGEPGGAPLEAPLLVGALLVAAGVAAVRRGRRGA